MCGRGSEAHALSLAPQKLGGEKRKYDADKKASSPGCGVSCFIVLRKSRIKVRGVIE